MGEGKGEGTKEGRNKKERGRRNSTGEGASAVSAKLLPSSRGPQGEWERRRSEK